MQLFFLMEWMNMEAEMDAKLFALAEASMIEILREIQMSRAAGGFAARLDVTRRVEQDVKQIGEPKKPGILRSLFGGQKAEEQEREASEESMY